MELIKALLIFIVGLLCLMFVFANVEVSYGADLTQSTDLKISDSGNLKYYCSELINISNFKIEKELPLLTTNLQRVEFYIEYKKTSLLLIRIYQYSKNTNQNISEVEDIKNMVENFIKKENYIKSKCNLK